MGWNERVAAALESLSDLIDSGELQVKLSAPIEADIIDADMAAVTGTAPSAATLYDILDSLDNHVGGGSSLADVDASLMPGGDLYDMLQLFYDDMWLGIGDLRTDVQDLLVPIQDVYSAVGDVEMAVSGLDYTLSDIYSAITQGSPVMKEDWADKTAPGSTPSIQLTEANPIYHVLQVYVQNINTNVVVRLEGSMNNNGWYNLGDADLTITANGFYGIHAQGMAEYVRGTFVSEAGGTDAVVSFDYYGMR